MEHCSHGQYSSMSVVIAAVAGRHQCRSMVTSHVTAMTVRGTAPSVRAQQKGTALLQHGFKFFSFLHFFEIFLQISEKIPEF